MRSSKVIIIDFIRFSTCTISVLSDSVTLQQTIELYYVDSGAAFTHTHCKLISATLLHRRTIVKSPEQTEQEQYRSSTESSNVKLPALLRLTHENATASDN